MKYLSKAISLVHWVPIIFVLFLFTWASFSYIVQMCIFMVPNLAEKIVYIPIFSLFLSLAICSFLRATLTHTAKVPYQFFLTNEELDIIKNSNDQSYKVIEAKGLKLRVQARSATGGIRYCTACKCIKPDRAHHCSNCKRCILKMDHHCPWINNCVCYNNYKYFVLFLFYTSLLCLFTTTTSFKYFITFWRMHQSFEDLKPESNVKRENLKNLSSLDELIIHPLKKNNFTLPPSSPLSTLPSRKKGEMGSLNIVLLFVVSGVFLFAILSLLVFHLNLIINNQSTLESMRPPIFRSGPDKSAYNKGLKDNIVEVFGRNPFLALLPINTDLGDGISFTARISAIPVGYRSLDNTPNNNDNILSAQKAASNNSDGLTQVVSVQPSK